MLRDIHVRQPAPLPRVAGRHERGHRLQHPGRRLKRLVAAGLLTREDTRPGQRAAYSLTEPAIQLVPVLAELGAWGTLHRPTIPRLRVRAELLADGGPDMRGQFMDELREL